MFKHAIVKRPSKSMVKGITEASLGKPIFEKAMQQHEKYVEALKKCGLQVEILPADETYPDSCFVEDAALVTRECAIITNLGAASRKGEEKSIQEALKKYYPEERILFIQPPGTIEGGDIMMVGDHFYIGLSDRTNVSGAEQMMNDLGKYGFTASTISMKAFLHLKTGSSYIENNNMLATGEFIKKPEFKKYHIIEVPPSEDYAANCIWINNHVIVPAGYPETERKIRELGYKVIPVEMSEFRKLDGGLSCLSLRF